MVGFLKDSGSKPSNLDNRVLPEDAVRNVCSDISVRSIQNNGISMLQTLHS